MSRHHHHLRTRYVDHVRDPGKDNIIIVWKHTRPANNKFYELPYYVARVQRRKRYVKLRWLDRHFPEHEFIVKIPNSVHAFNRFKEEGHVEPVFDFFFFFFDHKLIYISKTWVTCHIQVSEQCGNFILFYFLS